jgi:hypothetical protein
MSGRFFRGLPPRGRRAGRGRPGASAGAFVDVELTVVVLVGEPADPVPSGGAGTPVADLGERAGEER